MQWIRWWWIVIIIVWCLRRIIFHGWVCTDRQASSSCLSDLRRILVSHRLDPIFSSFLYFSEFHPELLSIFLLRKGANWYFRLWPSDISGRKQPGSKVSKSLILGVRLIGSAKVFGSFMSWSRGSYCWSLIVVNCFWYPITRFLLVLLRFLW